MAEINERKIIRTIPYEEWSEQGKNLFGNELSDWEFLCPGCYKKQSKRTTTEFLKDEDFKKNVKEKFVHSKKIYMPLQCTNCGTRAQDCNDIETVTVRFKNSYNKPGSSVYTDLKMFKFAHMSTHSLFKICI